MIALFLKSDFIRDGEKYLIAQSEKYEDKDF